MLPASGCRRCAASDETGSGAHAMDRSRIMPKGGLKVYLVTALLCALAETSADPMFSIDYPFESIPNGPVWFDEYVRDSLNARDLVKIGRNNALRVYPKLREAPNKLERITTSECQVGGLRTNEGRWSLGCIISTGARGLYTL